jgi:hypothetical protein
MVSKLMRLVLHTVETCIYKRKLTDFFEPLFFGVTLHGSTMVKHLGLVLDSWLTWRDHVNMNINVTKAHNRYVELRPKVVNWLYVSIVRQSITSALVVCWPGRRTASAKKTKQDTRNCMLSDKRGDNTTFPGVLWRSHSLASLNLT